MTMPNRRRSRREDDRLCACFPRHQADFETGITSNDDIVDEEHDSVLEFGVYYGHSYTLNTL